MTDKNLIFLISQPRSGSTLTQKILGSHSAIYTRSEPWIMLNPLYALKKNGVFTEYNKSLEYKATQDFIENLPNGGRNNYIQHLHNMYLSLYSEYLKKEKKSVFLDKTPRYYLIINELIEVFPEAKYILLIRNPLAVLGSIINSWTKEDWHKLSQYKIDLINGIDCILNGIEHHKTLMYILYYEDLLHDQVKTTRECFSYMELDFEEKVLNYHQQKSEKWLYGDPENVYKKEGIDTSNDLKWIENLKNPQYWRVIYDYLHYIGEEKFQKLGYSFSKNLEILKSNMPAETLDDLRVNTFSLFSFLDDTRECLIENQQNKQVINQKNQKLQEKEEVINQKNQKLQEKEEVINQKNQKLQEKKQELQEKGQKLQEKGQELQEKGQIIDKNNIELQNYSLLLEKIKFSTQVKTFYHPIKKLKKYKEVMSLYHNLERNRK